jgi:ParB-like chromosome segregation protein Spo0J
MELKISYGITVDLEKIKPNPWNVNKTTPRQQEAIAESLEAYGQVACLLCRKKGDTYEIIDGEHRYQELVNGKKSTAVINVIDKISDSHAKKLSVILNETKGSADKVDLASLLTDIFADADMGDDLIMGLPYSHDELKTLLDIDKFNWDQYMADQTEKKENEPETLGKDEKYLKLAIKVDRETKQLLEEAIDKSVKDKPLAMGFAIAKLLEELVGKNKEPDVAKTARRGYDEISDSLSPQINFDDEG